MPDFRTQFHLDFETFSKADLKAVGLRAYAVHPSTEITLAAFAYDDDEVELYDIADQYEDPEAAKAEIVAAVRDPTVQLYAWNAQFEREMLEHVWGLPTPSWRWFDPMATAYSLSLPGQLGMVSTILGLDADEAKMKEGKALIQKFCKPQPKGREVRRRTHKTDPKDWDTFGRYCINDVKAERACGRRMKRYALPQHEQALWQLDQDINSRGMPIDLELCDAAQAVSDELKGDLKRECAVLTGLANPNSRDQFLEWVQGEGYTADTLTKGDVTKALNIDPLTDTARAALALRSQFSKNSVAKYKKIVAQTVNGWLSYVLQFMGAGRTGRWAGRGAQYHNLPKPQKELEEFRPLSLAVEAIKRRDPALMRILFDKPVDVLASAIRPTIRAPEGKILRVADYNAIENRVLGWVARCQSILDVFRNDLDPYKAFGVEMFEIPYEDITKAQRTIAKPAVLGAGFMLSGGQMKDGKKTGLWAYAENMGIEMDQETAGRSVAKFRETYSEVVDFWDVIDKACRDIILRKSTEPTKIPVGFSSECLEVGYKKPFMYIKLPSGRCLWYLRPRVEMCKMPWTTDDDLPVFKMGITYEGLNQITNFWGRVTTHPGKLTENVVQAIARDILANGIVNAEAAGFTTILHVHDEDITLEDIDDEEHTVEILCDVLCDMPGWALDMPMKAEGYESPFYMKD